MPSRLLPTTDARLLRASVAVKMRDISLKKTL
jgi:hypothetical protein